MSSAPGLRVEGVCFDYGGAGVLQNVRFRLAEGEFATLLGPSGCGKSTLLRLIAGLEQPLTGSVEWHGLPIEGPSIERSVVFQDYALFPWLDIRDNVALAARKAEPALKRSEARERASELLSRVGLAEAARKYPFELSGGMRQRGALARSLATGAQVLLLDEPFGALDPLNRARLQDLLLDVWQSASPRKTFLFVTHDIDEALYLGDRIIVLGAAPGHVIADRRIAFERPRPRAELFSDQRFIALREQIAGAMSAETLAVIEAAT